MRTAKLSDPAEKVFDRQLYAQQFKAMLHRLQMVQPPLTEEAIAAALHAYQLDNNHTHITYKKRKAENQ